ncbi:MAG: acyltransferase [Micromonosporaceae bacterium]|nr:acyltransferase [Micromonosporaceae bacterium]
MTSSSHSSPQGIGAVDPPGAASAGARATPAPGRERGIDTWRAAALLRVIVYHTLGWAGLTIVFPAMGLMFALAGSLMARSLDRRGTRVVADRLRRLLPPLWAFAVCALAVMVGAGWRDRPASPLGWGELLWWIIPVRTPPAGGPAWAWAFTSMLWYLVAYLWLVVLSPVMLAVFRRWPGQVLGASLLWPVAVHFQVVTIGGYLVEPLANVSTYACCWLLGFAHNDRLMRRLTGGRFAVPVVLVAVASAAWLFHLGSGQSDFDVNHVPLANSLWSAAFVAVVLRFDLPIGGLRWIAWLQRAVDVINTRAVTVYLWHFCMLIAAQRLLGDPQRPYSAQQGIMLVATVCVLTAVATLLVGWVEDLAARRPPRLVPPGQRTRAAS